MTWKVMQRNAWKDIAKLEIKQLSNYTKSQRHACDDHQCKEEENESVRALSKGCSQIVLTCLYLARIGRPDILWSVNKLARAVTKWTKSSWQTFGAFDLVHSHMWVPTILLFGKHSTTLQIRIISRLWICRRSRRLKMNIRRSSVRFRESHVCTNKLDVQETNFSFTQFHGSRNYFSGLRRATEKLVGKHSTKHAKADSNAHQPRSDQYWSRFIKRETFWFQCYVTGLWEQWSCD